MITTRIRRRRLAGLCVCSRCRSRADRAIERSGDRERARHHRCASKVASVLTSRAQQEFDSIVRSHLVTARQLVPMFAGGPIRSSSGFGVLAARVEEVDGVPAVVGEWVATETVTVTSIDVIVEALEGPFYTHPVDHTFVAGDSYRLTIPLS